LKVLYVTALLQIRVPPVPGRGIRLTESHFLTNDASVIAGFIDGTFEKEIGSLETRALRRAPAAFYMTATLDPPLRNAAEATTFLNHQLAVTQTFLNCLWLVKDNAVNFELGFLKHSDRVSEGVTSNFLNSRFSTAGHEFPDTDFSLEDLRLARSYFQKLFGAHKPGFEVAPASEMHSPETDRVGRALYYLQAARAAPEISLKIAHYVTCLEALFCSDATEVSHKLAERLALFIGKTTSERIDIFRSAKAAYGIRSKTAHGDRLAARQVKDAVNVSVGCDELIRRALLRISTSAEIRAAFGGPNEQFDEFMMRLLF
jgi:hypothetical protein